MTRARLLKYALVAVGVVFLLVYPLAVLWPWGFYWAESGLYDTDYALMIVGIYATLGIFLILAARDPGANRSLIRFTIVSSLVHAAVMAWEAFRAPQNMAHLWGDVPSYVAVAAVLFALDRPSRNA